MVHHHKVLITGVTGLIGGIVFNDLKDDYEITGLARRPMEGLRHFRGSIDNLEEILPAFEGQHAVVHLAADPSGHAPWKSVLPNNLIGTYNMYEASRICGVKRVIFAISPPGSAIETRHSSREGAWKHRTLYPSIFSTVSRATSGASGISNTRSR